MNISRHQFNEVQYILQFILGVVWFGMSLWLFFKPDANLLFDTLPGIFLFVAGVADIYLGVDAYLLRKEPDMWR